MKKTQFIEMLKNIKNTMVSYISILLFIALGVALYNGFSWAAESVELSMDNEYRLSKMADLELVYPLGFTDDVLDELKKVEGVDHIASGYYSFERFEFDNNIYTVRVGSMTSDVNEIIQIDGELPKGEDEIAVQKLWAKTYGLEVGDVIEFTDRDVNCFKQRSFKVTALVEHPNYLNGSSITYGMSFDDGTPLATLMFVDEEAFDEKAFPGKLDLFIKSDELDEVYTYSDEYTDRVDELKDRVKEKLEELYQLPQAISLPVVSTRVDNATSASTKQTTDKLNSVKTALSALFVIVAIFVCFSTVSRMVNEQSMLIGVKRALGIRAREISLGYMLYSGSAGLIGVVLGGLLSKYVLSPAVAAGVKGSLLYENVVLYSSITEVLEIGVVELVLVLLATLIASRRVLRRKTTDLLIGAGEVLGRERFYEKSKLWNKLSLFTKTIINNSFNDKRRVFATLIGVAGCTALVVCGLSFRISVMGSFDIQYEDLYGTDSLIYYDESLADDELFNYLDDNNIDYFRTYFAIGTMIDSEDNRFIAYLFSSDDENFTKLYNVDPYFKEAENTDTSKGVWINQSYYISQGLEPGDTVTYRDMYGIDHDITVDGCIRHYLPRHQLVMDKESYEAFADKKYENTAIFFSTKGLDKDIIYGDICRMKGVKLVMDEKADSYKVFESFASATTGMVIVYLVLACAMAILVLLVLFNMFVAEKKNELIILMINGYAEKTVKRYIYTDTIFLTVIGIVLGTILGIYVAGISVDSIQGPALMFDTSIKWLAVAAGATFTVAVTVIMSKISLRKIKHMKLTDINK